MNLLLNYISPSILNLEKAAVKEKLSLLPNPVVHVDVMDGVFVPNNTLEFLSPEFVSSLVGKKSVHLMVADAEEFVQRYAPTCQEVYLHFESKNLLEGVSLAKKKGLGVGVVIKPKTPANALTDYADVFDGVMVMTVEPGFGGQKFMQECVPKIAECRKLFGEKDVWVDGGVNLETISFAKHAGANAFVVGTALFKNEDLGKAYREFEGLVR